MSVDNYPFDYSIFYDSTIARYVTINHTKTVVMHINLTSSHVPPPALSLGPNTFQVVEVVMRELRFGGADTQEELARASRSRGENTQLL